MPIEITPQPDETTCGPACLHSVYRFFGRPLPLDRLLNEVQQLPDGGTLAVWLALHAMDMGYDATIYTCDLHLFDPTWFQPGGRPIAEGLRQRMHVKTDAKFHATSQAYLRFLELGGKVHMTDITQELLGELLADRGPLVVGLSATWLYQCARERPDDLKPDDVAGEPTGHFVIVYDLDNDSSMVHVADPYQHHPFIGQHHYTVHVDRLIGAMLLGIITYDARLLVLRPGDKSSGGRSSG
jgi:hypothetical protein